MHGVTMKTGVEKLHVLMPLSSYAFHKNRSWESNTLLWGVNLILPYILSLSPA